MNARRERRLPASATAIVRATSVVLFSVGIAKADDFNGSTTITNQTSSTGSDDTTTYIATSEASSVTVGTGGIWDNQYNIVVGYGAAGTLAIQDGGQVVNNLPPDSTTLGTYADSAIGGAYDANNDTQIFSTGSVTVDGAGSMWTANSNLIVGRLGSGSLSITNGGNVTSSLGSVSDGTDPTNGYGYPGGQGTVTIDGSGSEWSIAGQMQLGVTGTGNVTVQNGGELLVNTSGNASTSPALLVGVETYVPSPDSMNPYNLAYTGNGTLDINRGTVDLNQGDVSVGDGYETPGSLNGQGGDGQITVEGGGQLLRVGDLSMGEAAAGYSPGQATLTVEGTGSTVNAASLEVLANSVFALHAGGTVTVAGQLTFDTINTNGITIDGGTLTAGNTENDHALPQTGGTTSLGDVTGSGSLSVTNGSMTVGAVTQTSLEVGSGGMLFVSPSTSSGQLGSLQVDAGGSVQINGGGELQVTGTTITNNSTITIGTGTNTSPAILSVSGTGSFLLTGSGTVALNGADTAANLLVPTGASLTIDTNQIVAGQGQISGDITNNGTIDANMTADTLILSSPSFSNNGTLEATNGGLLELEGMTLTTVSLGVIKTIGAGSAIVIGPTSTLDGSGTITATLINDGTVNADSAGNTLAIQNSPFTNNGTLEATAGLLDLHGLSISQGTNGQITTSAGTVNLNGATVTGGSVSSSGGTLSLSSATFDNVTLPGGNTLPILSGTTLTLEDTFTNNGTVVVNSNQQTPAAVLLFSTSAILAGTGYVTLNQPGGSAQLNGTLTQQFGSTIDGQGQINAALTNAGTVDADVSGGTLTLQTSAMSNTGTLEATGGGTLDIEGITISQGSGGQITSDSTSAVIIGSAATVSGQGSIDAYLTNNGTIDADISGQTLTFFVDNATNNGTAEATAGGILQLTGGTLQQGASGTLVAGAGSTVNLAGVTIIGGSLDNSAGGTLDATSSTLQNVTLVANSSLSIPDGTTLTVSGTFTNNGTVNVNSIGGSNATALLFTGDAALDGTGEIILERPGSASQFDTAASSSVTIGSQQTVAGQGIISATLTNNGTINANVGGGTLTLSVNPTNNGLLEATSGGNLDLDGLTITQNSTGEISANQATVDLIGSTISGGILDDANSGSLNFFGLTLQNTTFTTGSTMTIQSDDTLTILGTITNNGTIYGQSDSHGPGPIVAPSTATLTGTGTVQLHASHLDTVNSGSLTIGSSQTVHGYGIISADLTNNGTVQADAGGQTLTIAPSDPDIANTSSPAVTNNGTFAAINGATLDFTGITVTNTGTLLAKNSGIVQFDGTNSVNGGDLTSDATTYLYNNGNITLNGVTLTTGSTFDNTGQNGNVTVTLQGTITNNGTIYSQGYFEGNAPVLATSTVTLGGDGYVQLHDADLDTTGSGSLTIGPNQTVHGYGTISATLTNNGIISADNGGQTLAINDTDPNVANTSNPAITNTGVIQGINGAILDFVNIAVTNTSTGTLSATNSGIVQFDGTNSVTGGTLTSDSTTELLNNGGSTTFDNLAISTGTTIDNTGNHGGVSLILQGTINNNGTIFGNSGFNGTAPILATTIVTLTGSGNVQLRSSSFDTTGTGSITIGSNQTIHGYGTISATMTNNGAISADNGGQTLTISSSDSNVANTDNPSITNADSINATNGGTLDLVNTSVTNTGTLSADTSSRFQFDGTNSVTGGTLTSDSTSELQINSGITTLNGVTISTGTSLYNNGNNGAATLALQGTITNNGSIYSQGYYEGNAPITVAPNTDLVGSGEISLSRGELDPAVVGAILTQSAGHTITGQSSTINVPIDNNGTVSAPGSTLQMTAALDNTGSVDVGGTFAMNATFTQTAGATTVDGNLQLNSGPMLLEGGILGGSGSISGSVLNTGGTISPGDSPGILTVSGDVTQSTAGSLLIEIAGTTVGTEYDQLDINGTATLDGYLDVTTLEGYVPIYGTTFDILHAGDVQGTFADISPGWYAVYTPTDVFLTAVPEPASGAILAACGGMLLARRRLSERRRGRN